MGFEPERLDLEKNGLDRDGMIENWQRLNVLWMKKERDLNNGHGGWFTIIGILQVVAYLCKPR